MDKKAEVRNSLKNAREAIDKKDYKEGESGNDIYLWNLFILFISSEDM